MNSNELQWGIGAVSREAIYRGYKITDMGNIVAIVKLRKNKNPLFVGQYSNLTEGLEEIQ